MLRGKRGGTDFVKSVLPRAKVDHPCGGHPAVFCHGNIMAKSGNCLRDTINTPLRSPLEYTHSLQ
jgi:hypothetical protein